MSRCATAMTSSSMARFDFRCGCGPGGEQCGYRSACCVVRVKRVNAMSDLSGVNVLERLAAPESRGNPYPLLRWLRENEPVHRTEAGFFLVSRHADVQWALSRTGDALVVPDREELSRQFPGAGDHAAIEIALEIFGAMLRP